MSNTVEATLAVICGLEPPGLWEGLPTADEGCVRGAASGECHWCPELAGRPKAVEDNQSDRGLGTLGGSSRGVTVIVTPEPTLSARSKGQTGWEPASTSSEDVTEAVGTREFGLCRFSFGRTVGRGTSAESRPAR